jgi:hypothetical protein
MTSRADASQNSTFDWETDTVQETFESWIGP